MNSISATQQIITDDREDISGGIIPFPLSINDTNKRNKPLELSQIYNERAIEELVGQIKIDILSIIQNDEYEAGKVSQAQLYIMENIDSKKMPLIKQAIMDLYIDYYDNKDVLSGLLTMMYSMDYEHAKPQGQIMVLGLLQHNDIYVRDMAIRAFEKWNSREGIHILKSIKCDASWLQRYIDKVVFYLERDGI